jgi:hypothetical protein
MIFQYDPTETTAQTIQKLDAFRADVLTAEIEREAQKAAFTAKDLIVKKNGLFLNEVPFSVKAQKQLLSFLKVRNNFLDFNTQMSTTDWETVTDKLRNASSDRIIHGYSEEGMIDEVFISSKKGHHQGYDLEVVFEMLRNILLNSSKEFIADRFSYSEGIVNVSLLERDLSVDVIPGDTWKIGKQLSWGRFTVKAADYLNRLVCTNGATMQQFGKKTDIGSNKYKQEFIDKILFEAFEADNSIPSLVKEAVQHLNGCNASIDEYLSFRKALEVDDEDPRYDIHEKVITENFDIGYLNRAYGKDVTEMKPQWKKTADTGKNAYDLFNTVTYIASHTEENGVKPNDALALQIAAGKFLFKEDLDIETIAPKMVFSLN